MEDMIEVLSYASRFRPMVLEGAPCEELLLFFVTFLGSSHYIHNPYLRSKMVEVGSGDKYLVGTTGAADKSCHHRSCHAPRILERRQPKHVSSHAHIPSGVHDDCINLGMCAGAMRVLHWVIQTMNLFRS